jgi:hypothetical protein
MDQYTSVCVMTVRPVSLNAAIASLFIVGSALFISDRYRRTPTQSSNGRRHHLFRRLDLLTAASFAQLVQAQTPAMTEVDPPGARARAGEAPGLAAG